MRNSPFLALSTEVISPLPLLPYVLEVVSTLCLTTDAARHELEDEGTGGIWIS